MLRQLVALLLLLPALAAPSALQAKDKLPKILAVAPGTPLHAEIVDAAQDAVAAKLGLPVRLDATELRAGGGFAFLAATVTAPDGSEIDFSETPYRAALEDGMFDGPQLWALLGERDGVWSVLEQDIGPTDAWYLYWPSHYEGASCELVFEGFTNC